MAHTRNYLALDLGASSGRALLCQFDGEKLAVSEAHRFANGPARVFGSLYWDALQLWSEIKTGIARASQEGATELAGVGLDTWGVDFALLDRQGALLGNPFHYRDARTDGMFEEAFQRMPRDQIFEQTGIQFLQLNTLYQLLSMVISRSPLLETAETLLTIPSLFHYWLSGRMATEFSHATTTQCYDPRKRSWAYPVLDAMAIPSKIFGEIVPAGTVLGPLLASVADEICVPPMPIIAPATHDTGSAVAAVPASAPGFAWISSGTWSIMGAELDEPLINAQSLAYNMTNEGGPNYTYRFCKNIIGLWLLQESRRTWAAHGQQFSYEDLTQLAARADRHLAVIDADHLDFMKPGDMPARIQAYCRRTGQVVPETKGAVVRCVLEGIALKYRMVLEGVEAIIGHRLDPVYIVGGGTQNRLLSQFAADALGRRVITGPVEATATGNALVQAIALRDIGSLAEAREVVRKSFDLLSFEPGDTSGWDDAYARLLALTGRT